MNILSCCQVLSNTTDCSTKHCNQPAQIFSKAVIILIDALKYDFCVHNGNLSQPGYSENKLPVLQKYSSPDTDTGLSPGKLYKFIADPPTTTMQRLKGLTTGSLPTFIDVSSNFASYAITEDNIVDQLVANGRRVVFAGDDTWTNLYPDSFTLAYPQPSFDVWDLDTVDREVTKVIRSQLKQTRSWDVLIGHYLGVDHTGHKFGPNHPEMARKLSEMNTVIEHVITNLPADTVLFVFGDHGMTSSGDHGGDSDSEVTAGMFVYSPGLALKHTDQVTSVAQIDLVPSLSLLLGVPIPFSNLGALIEDLFVPTSMLKNVPHSKLGGYSSEDLATFRLPYIKNNVNQVYKYLTAYLAQGGTFPEAANSRIRHLASQVINKPGALSFRQLVELIKNSAAFLQEARAMCQSVWVEFNLSAMNHGLNIMLLHTSVLVLLILKPQNRLLTMLISLLTLCVSLVLGGFLGVTISCLTGYNFYSVVIGTSSAASTLTQGFTLLWKLRQSLVSMTTSLLSSFTWETSLLVLIYLSTLVTNFSNSFVILQAQTLNFLIVTILMLYLYKNRRNSQGKIPCTAIILCIGLVQFSMIYVRCREEQGSDCVQTDFHKPLSTLPQSAGTYKNWRYFFTMVCLVATCSAGHFIFSRGGNLNGFSIPVLVSGYFPWIIVIIMICYWALQAFPITLISKLLPWQQNILAQSVLLLSFVGLIILVINPKLVYLIPKKTRPNQIIPKQENVATYFNYLKSNWKSTLSQGEAPNPMNIAYGLGTCISAVIISITSLVSLISMLLLGDGQAPALCLHLVISALILLVTTPPRLSTSQSTSALFRVPNTVIVLWYLQDLLSFFTTGHQPTFPHIQWSAAFVGFAGTEFGGDSILGHVIPAVLVGWNTFASVIISGLSLPLLILAPPLIWLHIPSLRPSPSIPQSNGYHGETLMGDDIYAELMKGEALFLDRVEETRGAVLTLSCQYIVIRAVRMISTVLAAAILRRHLMVWKIFAPNFIFETVGFFVSLISVVIGFIIFNRVLSVLNRWYYKIQKL